MIDIQSPVVRHVNDLPLPPATDVFRESLNGSAGTTVFLGAHDASIGMGVYDVAGIWPGLPFDFHDYASDVRSISFRDGSAASFVSSQSMALFGTQDVRQMFPDSGTPPYVDFVYPLFSATTVEGRLITNGVTSEEVDSLTSKLIERGYEVDASVSTPFMSPVLQAPIALLVLLVIVLGEVGACASWWVQSGRLRPPLQDDAPDGTRVASAVVRQLWVPATAWIAAFALSALPLALIIPTMRGSATELGLAWLVALVIDLLLALGLFVISDYRLADRRTP